MNNTEIYLEASRRLAEGEDDYACNAIWRVAKSNGDNSIAPQETMEVIQYCSVFNDGDYWGFSGLVNRAGTTPAAARNLRVMMTSLMAVCWQDFK